MLRKNENLFNFKIKLVSLVACFINISIGRLRMGSEIESCELKFAWAVA